MANAVLGIPEQSALLAVLMIGGKASNPDLRERFEFVIDKPVRERLVRAELITAYKDKQLNQAYVHELTEQGWRHCREHFTDSAPPGAHKAYRLMYGLTQWFSGYMDRAQVALADITVAESDDDTEDEATTVDERIIAVYRELAAEPAAWVGLAELRKALPEVPRAEFDDALGRIAEWQGVYFTPEVNQKTLTAADRKASVHLGGEDKHLLSVKEV